MKEDSKSAWQLAHEEIEEKWLAEGIRREADAEFRRARRKAMGRLIFGSINRHRKNAGIEEWTSSGLMIPIDSITGIIDSKGRRITYLPSLNRKLAEAWRRAFLIDDVEAYPALKVRRGSGGWYLVGDAESLLFLEIMRAKAHSLLRVMPEPECAISSCRSSPDPVEVGECRAELPPKIAC